MNGERGFAYLFLLIVIAVIAGAAATALSQGSHWARRSSEQELLIVGQAYQAALYSYAGERNLERGMALPGVAPLQGPASLEDLLQDPRPAHLTRHLRKLYADPMTGSRDWGVLRDQSGRIIGLHSLSEEVPLKRSGFPPSLNHFSDAKSYRDWIFGLPGAALIANPSPFTLSPQAQDRTPVTK